MENIREFFLAIIGIAAALIYGAAIYTIIHFIIKFW